RFQELILFEQRGFPQGHPFNTVYAMPKDIALPPIWLLGSSGYSAQLAAMVGMGFAFAHHFSDHDAVAPMLGYREQFKPSATLERHAGAPMNCWRTRSSCASLDPTKSEPRPQAGVRIGAPIGGSSKLIEWRMSLSENRFHFSGTCAGLLSGGRRIDGPLVGAEVAEQHLTGLHIFLGEAAARRWASVDRASGNGGATYDRSAAHDRSAGNGPCIRNAHAAAAVDVGIDVRVRVGIGVVVSVVIVSVVIVIV